MIAQPSPREMQLAREHVERLKSQFSKMRTASVLLALLFFALSVPLYIVELPMLAFCSVLLGLLFVLRCVDANSHLRTVRLRSTKTLVTRVGILEQEAPTKAVADSSASN
ncbi:MAG: hypothetical protein WD669_06030 [Pirellulales bacterium]